MSPAASRSPRARRLWWQAAVVTAAGTVAVLLAQQTSGAVFTAQSGNGTDKVTTAASFCASPGVKTVYPSMDAPIYQANPTTNYQFYPSVGTISYVGSVPAGNARSLIRFALQPAGALCTLTAATLTLYATAVTAGRPINVFRVNPATAWSDASVTWSNQPSTTGSAVSSNAPSSANTTQVWNVLPLVTAEYSAGLGADQGLMMIDAAENNATSAAEYYDSNDGTNRPYLTLTWG